MSNDNRPIVASIVQYIDAIESGSMSVMKLVEKAAELGVDGIELRREAWGENMNTELPGIRERASELGLLVTFATHGVLFCEGDARDQLLADVDTAAEIGSPHLRIFSGPVPESDDHPDWDWVQQVIDHAAQVHADHLHGLGQGSADSLRVARHGREGRSLGDGR